MLALQRRAVNFVLGLEGLRNFQCAGPSRNLAHRSNPVVTRLSAFADDDSPWKLSLHSEL
jgi:hypothetical protein